MKKELFSKMIKTMLALCLAFCMAVLMPLTSAQAATKPAKPVISIKSANDGTAVKVTISATERAEGYLIYMKSDTDTKYKKVKTLKKDGAALRSYTVKNLSEGTYSFKVKAYLKNNSKTVKSSYSKVKSITLESGTTVIAGDVAINETNFPDASFRYYVENNIDKDNNGVLSTTEISAVEDIILYECGLKSLKGLAFFVNLKGLYCDGNQLTSLDVSKNIALVDLELRENQLTSLDVSKNTALKGLTCDDNQLTSLDVSKNTALVYLECEKNQLTSLDVSKNTALEHLHCDSDVKVKK